MMPGPLAAATYAAVKITGYAGFAYGLNRMLGRNVREWKFGVAKTGIGLVGGLIYIFVILRAIDSSRLTNAQIFAGALPIRLVAWGLALALFYGFRDRPNIVVLALVAGVIWSYILDGLMAILYQLPGMAMPFC
jgi:hypothetical protein